MRQAVNIILRQAVETGDPILLDFLAIMWGSDDFDIPELAWFYDRQAQLRHNYFKHAQDRLYSRVVLHTCIKIRRPNITEAELDDIEDKDLLTVFNAARGNDNVDFNAQLTQALGDAFDSEVKALIEGSFEGLERICIEKFATQRENDTETKRLISREFLSINDEEEGLSDQEKTIRRENRENALKEMQEDAQAYKDQFLKEALSALETLHSVNELAPRYQRMLNKSSEQENQIKDWQTVESHMYLGLEKVLVKQKKSTAKYVCIWVDRLKSCTDSSAQESYKILADAAASYTHSMEPEVIHQCIKTQLSRINVWCTDIIDEQTGDTLLHLAAKAGKQEVFWRIFGPQQFSTIPGYVVEPQESAALIWKRAFGVEPQVVLRKLIVNLNQRILTILKPAIIAIIPAIQREEARQARNQNAVAFSSEAKLAHQLLQAFASEFLNPNDLANDPLSDAFKEGVYVCLKTIINDQSSWVHPAVLQAYALISNIELRLWFIDDADRLIPYVRSGEESVNYATFKPESCTGGRVDLLMKSKGANECQRLTFKGYEDACVPADNQIIYPYSADSKVGETRRLTFLEYALATDSEVMNPSDMSHYDRSFGEGRAKLLKESLLELGRQYQFSLCEKNKAGQRFFDIEDHVDNTALHHFMKLGLHYFALQIATFGADLGKENKQGEVACKVFDPDGNTLAHCAYHAQENNLLMKMLLTYAVDIEIMNRDNDALIGLIKRDVELAYLRQDTSELAKSRVRLYQMIRQFFREHRRFHERWQAIKDSLATALIPVFKFFTIEEVEQLKLLITRESLATRQFKLNSPSFLAKIARLGVPTSNVNISISQAELVSLVRWLQSITQESKKGGESDEELSNPLMAKITLAVREFLSDKPHPELSETLLCYFDPDQVEDRHLELPSPTELGRDGKRRDWSLFERDMEQLLVASSTQAQAQSASFLTRLRAGCLTHRAYEHLLYERQAIRNALDLDLFLSHIQQNDLPLFERAHDERVRQLNYADKRQIGRCLETAVGSTEYALGVKETLDARRAAERDREARERAEAQAVEERRGREQERQAREHAEAQTAEERRGREQERQAKEQERQEKEQERQAREQAEARIRELEAELRRKQGHAGDEAKTSGAKPTFF